MLNYQQQLVANLLKLFAVYRRTKDEAVLEILEGLLGCLRDTLDPTVQPTLQPTILPITYPLMPAERPIGPPYDPGGVYVYACPGLEPFRHTTDGTETSDTIFIPPRTTATGETGAITIQKTTTTATGVKLDDKKIATEQSLTSKLTQSPISKPL